MKRRDFFSKLIACGACVYVAPSLLLDTNSSVIIDSINDTPHPRYTVGLFYHGQELSCEGYKRDDFGDNVFTGFPNNPKWAHDQSVFAIKENRPVAIDEIRLYDNDKQVMGFYHPCWVCNGTLTVQWNEIADFSADSWDNSVKIDPETAL